MDLDAMPTVRPHLSAIFGSAGEYGEWQIVMRAFMEEKLEAAHESALALGAGPTGAQLRSYRQIEAEAATRKVSEIRRISEWLQIESSPHVGSARDQDIEAIIEATATRFQYTDRPNLLVTLLIPEVDAPWAPGRAGYFIDKTPYAKICIPSSSATSHAHLLPVLAHEYTHLIVLDLAQGASPRWLNEAIAQVAEDRSVDEAVAAFAQERMPWRAEHPLENAFASSSADHQGLSILGQAYAQSAVIGRYLAGLKGDDGLMDLLRGFSNNSGWLDVKMAITGQEPVDEAIREVYGFGVTELFERAKPKL